MRLPDPGSEKDSEESQEAPASSGSLAENIFFRRSESEGREGSPLGTVLKLSVLVFIFFALSHSKNRAVAHERPKLGAFRKTYCYHK